MINQEWERKSNKITMNQLEPYVFKSPENLWARHIL